MRRNWRQFVLVWAIAVAANDASAAIYVSQVGETDSPTALTSAAAPVFLQKFDSAGALQSTLALPTTVSGGQRALTLGGTATSVGYLDLSGNGQYLFLGGFDAPVGTAAVAGTTATSTAFNRVVGRIDLATNMVDTSTAFTDGSYSGENIRSVTSTNGTDIWTAGNATGANNAANGGVRYATFGATASTQLTNAVGSTVNNTRVVKIFNDQLYVSAMSGTFRGVNTVGTGVPTVTGQTVTLLPGFDPVNTAQQSVYDFWFKDDNTLYVADDRGLASGGGIQKWTFDAIDSEWVLDYTLNVNAGARGLAATVNDNGDAVLYATTADSPSRLATITDTGADAVFTTLATAGANTQFRGVEFVAETVTPGNNADFDNDGDVDGADFLTWQKNLGATGQPNKSTGDATGDGAVNAADLAEWQQHFGGAPAAGAASSVPEPASGLIAALGLAVVAVGRRSRRMLN
jgi:hypothetical protein